MSVLHLKDTPPVARLPVRSASIAAWLISVLLGVTFEPTQRPIENGVVPSIWGFLRRITSMAQMSVVAR